MEEIEVAIREYDNRLKDLQKKVDIWKFKKGKTSIENYGDYLQIWKKRQKLREDLDNLSHIGRLIEALIPLNKRKSRPLAAPLAVIKKETLDMLKHLKKYFQDERKLK